MLPPESKLPALTLIGTDNSPLKRTPDLALPATTNPRTLARSLVGSEEQEPQFTVVFSTYQSIDVGGTGAKDGGKW